MLRQIAAQVLKGGPGARLLLIGPNKNARVANGVAFYAKQTDSRRTLMQYLLLIKNRLSLLAVGVEHLSGVFRQTK